MPQDKVSVIIRTYPDRPDIFLIDAISSVINQSYKNIQLIISSDGVREITPALSRVLMDAKEKIYDVVFLQNTKRGKSFTGNQGLVQATGKYINFLDDDDYFYPNHIQRLLDCLTESPNLDAVYACTHLKRYKFKNGKIEEGKSINYLGGSVKFYTARLACESFTPMQSVMFKKTLYEKHGGFDIRLEHAEDWDLWNRYLSSGLVKEINEFTSVIRQELNYKKLLKRNQNIANYHKIIRANQKEIYVTLSLSEIAEYFDDVNNSKNTKFSLCFNICVCISKIYRRLILLL